MKTTTSNRKSGLKSRSEQLGTENEGGVSGQASEKSSDTRVTIDRAERAKNRKLPASELLSRLMTTLPDAYGIAEVVGKWVWIQFQEIPSAEIRRQLAQLGFHWNNARRLWQHPCGLFQEERATVDPRKKYKSHFAADVRPA